MDLLVDGRIVGQAVIFPIIIMIIIISAIIIIHDQNTEIARSSPIESGKFEILPIIHFISQKCDIIICLPALHRNSIQVDFGISPYKVW